jgi:hypothetical protein
MTLDECAELRHPFCPEVPTALALTAPEFLSGAILLRVLEDAAGFCDLAGGIT